MQKNGAGVLDTINENQGNYQVESFNLDSFSEQNKITPNIIKIDVEGAEMLVLKGAINILKQYKPRIFLSTHSVELEKECLDFLKSLGYQLELIEATEYLAK